MGEQKQFRFTARADVSLRVVARRRKRQRPLWLTCFTTPIPTSSELTIGPSKRSLPSSQYPTSALPAPPQGRIDEQGYSGGLRLDATTLEK